jgi:hypothetical protein
MVVDVEVALASYLQTPAGVLCEGMEHVVEEADAGVDVDLLAVGFLCGMVFLDLLAFAVEVFLVESVPEVGLLVGFEFASVEVDGDLDLGLVGVAVEASGSRHCGGRSFFCDFVG